MQYVPASERRALFEDYCKEVGTNRAKAGGGGAKPSGRGAAAASSGAAAGGRAGGCAGGAAGEGDGGEKAAQAAFEQLLGEIQEACKPPPEEGEVPAAAAGGANGSAAGRGESGGGGGGKGAPLPQWDGGLTLAQLEPHWGEDPRWQGCSAAVRQRLFDERMARLKEEARKELEEGFRCGWRRWVGTGSQPRHGMALGQCAADSGCQLPALLPPSSCPQVQGCLDT